MSGLIWIQTVFQKDFLNTVKLVTQKEDQKLVFKTHYHLLQVKSIAECSAILQGEHSAILSTFIKLPFVIKIFVLSISEWPLKTGFTVHCVF